MIMSAPAGLVRLVEPWSQLYGDSKLIATITVFAHVAALVFAGGLAVTLDRATMRAVRSTDLRLRQLDELARAHRLVVAGLALSVVSGVLLFTADLETYFSSPIYWTKMVLIAVLLANGFVMTRIEAHIRTSTKDVEPAWRRLRVTAGFSLFLWFAITFVGVALVNAA